MLLYRYGQPPSWCAFKTRNEEDGDVEEKVVIGLHCVRKMHSSAEEEKKHSLVVHEHILLAHL